MVHVERSKNQYNTITLGIAIIIDIFYIGIQVCFSDNIEKLNDPRPDMHNINSVFFPPIGTATGTYSIGKNCVKIKQQQKYVCFVLSQVQAAIFCINSKLKHIRWQLPK